MITLRAVRDVNDALRSNPVVKAVEQGEEKVRVVLYTLSQDTITELRSLLHNRNILVDVEFVSQVSAASPVSVKDTATMNALGTAEMPAMNSAPVEVPIAQSLDELTMA